ncbi:hypothetical protein BC832DRAFT_602922 [Gaertneriomyces semiglobifer]|nr:hypothetical protein BC832DRAFT_602922 [Gaertneriomyces semiglobifer]
MGNSFTRAKDEESEEDLERKILVDWGSVLPPKESTIYPSAVKDYDSQILHRLIVDRKLAPFYQGVSEPTDVPSDFLPPPPSAIDNNSSTTSHHPINERLLSQRSNSSIVSSHTDRSFTLKGRRSGSVPSSSSSFHSATHPHIASTLASATDESKLKKTDVYKYTIECPICFLYYPFNINYSRCCDQPICSECFLQIRRSENNTDPTSCPYCVEPNFGILYHPPSSPEYTIKLHQTHPSSLPSSSLPSSPSIASLSPSISTTSTRRKSMSHTSPAVVTSDILRPDLIRKQQQAHLARLTRERVGRRAPRVVTMSAGDAAALMEQMVSTTGSGSESGRSSTSRGRRRGRRREELETGYLEAMRNMGADLEELMLMEAIRRSLQESPSQQQSQQSQQQPHPQQPQDQQPRSHHDTILSTVTSTESPRIQTAPSTTIDSVHDDVDALHTNATATAGAGNSNSNSNSVNVDDWSEDARPVTASSSTDPTSSH